MNKEIKNITIEEAKEIIETFYFDFIKEQQGMNQSFNEGIKFIKNLLKENGFEAECEKMFVVNKDNETADFDFNLTDEIRISYTVNSEEADTVEEMIENNTNAGYWSTYDEGGQNM